MKLYCTNRDRSLKEIDSKAIKRGFKRKSLLAKHLAPRLLKFVLLSRSTYTKAQAGRAAETGAPAHWAACILSSSSCPLRNFSGSAVNEDPGYPQRRRFVECPTQSGDEILLTLPPFRQKSPCLLLKFHVIGNCGTESLRHVVARPRCLVLLHDFIPVLGTGDGAKPQAGAAPYLGP